MLYRPEIDGLRAVAVIPVIFFHAGFNAFSGGYVGVDVFFVISGYLITSILLTEFRNGTFSILNFYERRARRILPALFVVMLCCVPFALLWMPVMVMQDFARSMVFTSVFASNFHFLEKAGGYFSVRSEVQPLLHTWSLAVEEQFYLVFPLLLGFLLSRRTRAVVAALAVVALLSFALSEWGSRNYQDANFYFTFSRFWELLAGAFCAFYLIDRPVKARGWLAGLGLAMIMGSVILFDPQIRFPSAFTLLPVLGTVAMILSMTPNCAVGRLLSWAPVVGIGLVSYSAYLWHQPIFAFARLRSVEEPGLALMLILIAATFVLAFLSWRFVEQPFRKPNSGFLQKRKAIFALSGACLAGFAAFGSYGMYAKGMPQRLQFLASNELDVVLKELSRLPDFQDCSDRAQPTEVGQLSCTAFLPDQASGTIAVMGDSHAEAVLPAFETLADALSMRVVVGTKSACPPLLGVYTSRSKSSLIRCHDYMRDLAEQLKKDRVSAVFLVAKWPIYTGRGLHPGNPRMLLRRTAQDAASTQEVARRVFENGLAQTISFFRQADIPVFLLRQVPDTRVSPNNFFERMILRGQDDDDIEHIIAETYTPIVEAEEAHDYANSVLTSLQSEGVYAISLNAAFSEGDFYKWFENGRSLYRDTSHLSLTGALFLREPLKREVMEVLRE